MAVGVDIHFEGGDELAAALRGLADKRAQGRVLRSGVRYAIKPVLGKIQANIRSGLTTMDVISRFVYAGQIRLSGTRFNPARGEARISIKTKDEKIRSGSGRMVNFNPLAHLFEGGVAPHAIHQPKRGRTIQHPGINSRPIWAQTFERTDRETLTRLRGRLWDRIDREWKKAKR